MRPPGGRRRTERSLVRSLLLLMLQACCRASRMRSVSELPRSLLSFKPRGSSQKARVLHGGRALRPTTGRARSQVRFHHRDCLQSVCDVPPPITLLGNLNLTAVSAFAEPGEALSQQAAQNGAAQPVGAPVAVHKHRSGRAPVATARLPLTARVLENGGRPCGPPVPQPAAKRVCPGLTPPSSVMGERHRAYASTATTPSLRRLQAGGDGIDGASRVANAPGSAGPYSSPPAANSDAGAAPVVACSMRSPLSEVRPPTRAEAGVGTSPGLRARQPKQAAAASTVQPSPSQQAEVRVAALAREPSTAAQPMPRNHATCTDGSQQAQVLVARPSPQDSVAMTEHRISSAPPSRKGEQRATSTAASPAKGTGPHAPRSVPRDTISQRSRADAATLVTPRLLTGAAASQAGGRHAGTDGAGVRQQSSAPAEVRGDSVQSLSAQDLASVPPRRCDRQPVPDALQTLHESPWHGFQGGNAAQHHGAWLPSPQEALAMRPQPRGAARMLDQQHSRRTRSPRAAGREVMASLYGGGRADEDLQIVGIGCAPVRSARCDSCMGHRLLHLCPALSPTVRGAAERMRASRLQARFCCWHVRRPQPARCCQRAKV